MEDVIVYSLLILSLAVSNFLAKRFIVHKFRFFSPDEFTHLGIIQSIKKNKGLPEIFDNFLIDKRYRLPFAYPFLMHYLLSFLSLEWVTKNRKEISIFLDSLNIILLGVFSFFITQQMFPSVLVVVIYVLLPYAFNDSVYFTPRPLCFLLVNLVLLLIASFHLVSLAVYIPLILITGILASSIFFLHKFSTQALLVCLVSLFLFLPEYRVEMLYLLSIIFFVLICSWKYYGKIFKEHIGCIIKSYHYIGKVDSKRLIALLATSAPFAGLSFFYLNNPDFFVNFSVNRIFSVWALSFGFIAYAAIFIKPLRSIGEGERYIVHSAVPISFLMGYFLANNYSVINLLLVVISIFSVFGLTVVTFRMVLRGKYILNDEICELCTRIKKLPKSNVWVKSREPSLICAVMHLAQKNVVNCLNITFFDSHPEVFSKLENKPIETIQEYGINYILLDRATLKNQNNIIKNYEVIIEVGEYCVSEVSSSY